VSNPERPWDNPPAAAKGPAKKKSPVQAWQWIVGAVILVGIFGAVAGSGGSEPDKYGAQEACENRVETLLKAPASADFSGVEATENGTNTWSVSGMVDAENSFGASMRNSFVCTAESDDGETWTTSKVSLN
jgi:hypothetical protein